MPAIDSGPRAHLALAHPTAKPVPARKTLSHAQHSLDGPAPAGVSTLQWNLSNRAERQEILRHLALHDHGRGGRSQREGNQPPLPGDTLARMARSLPIAGPVIAALSGVATSGTGEAVTTARPPRFKLEPRKELAALADPKKAPTQAQLQRFLAMLQNTPPHKVAGTTVRTPISSADGVTGINTGLTLSVIAKFYPIANTQQKAALSKALGDQLLLLRTPVAQGGLQMKGALGDNAVAGPTRGRGAPAVAINQTAVVLVGLHRLAQRQELVREFPQITQLIGRLTPEFKKELEQGYPARRPTPGNESWKYGPGKRIEDPAHVLTTYQQLLKLHKLINPDKDKPVDTWYLDQANRIRRTLPEVFDPRYQPLPDREPLGRWLANPHKATP